MCEAQAIDDMLLPDPRPAGDGQAEVDVQQPIGAVSVCVYGKHDARGDG